MSWTTEKVEKLKENCDLDSQTRQSRQQLDKNSTTLLGSIFWKSTKKKSPCLPISC